MSGVGAGKLARWWRRIYPARREPRLASDAVLALARSQAASEGYDPHQLQMVSHREVDGRIVWHVSEAAIGGVLLVEIDDEDGRVRSIGRLQGR